VARGVRSAVGVAARARLTINEAFPILASVFSEPAWFSVIGLALDIFAVVALAWELLLTDRSAFHSDGSSGGSSNTTPTRLERIRQSPITILCVFLLVLGFALQIIGNWPR